MKQTFSGIQMILAFVAGLLLGILIILSIVGINSLTGKEEKPAAPAEEQVDNPKVDILDVQEREDQKEVLTDENPSRKDTRIYSSEKTQPDANRPGNSNRSMTDVVNRTPTKESKKAEEAKKAEYAKKAEDAKKNKEAEEAKKKKEAAEAKKKGTSKETSKETSKSTRSMKDDYYDDSYYYY